MSDEHPFNGPCFNGLCTESIASLLTPFKCQTITVALSGGVDSIVLLHLLSSLRDQQWVDTVEAVHVHHGLSDYADQWADFCEYICQKWKIPLTVARISVPEGTGDGLEQTARKLRYSIFEQHVLDGSCLVMGHHQDDQAETVLLRLFRGTGLEGLCGMPKSRRLGEGLLLRPLLEIRRKTIEQYATHHQLEWIEDDSNQDERFSRNFLRQSLIPEIEQRWPGASQRIAALTDELTAVSETMQGHVVASLSLCQWQGEGWWQNGFSLLNIRSLKSLSTELQKQVFRLWLKNNTGSVLGRESLQKLFNELIDARKDAEPQLKVGDYIVRRFRGDLYITHGEEMISHDVQQWGWPISESLTLKDGLHLSGARTEVGSILLPNRQLQIRRREHIPAGEKIAIAGRNGRKTLKRWLQDYNLPPWCRHRQPFIYDGDRMIAAPGLWVCPEYYGKTGSGYSLNCVKI